MYIVPIIHGPVVTVDRCTSCTYIAVKKLKKFDRSSPSGVLAVRRLDDEFYFPGGPIWPAGAGPARTCTVHKPAMAGYISGTAPARGMNMAAIADDRSRLTPWVGRSSRRTSEPLEGWGAPFGTCNSGGPCPKASLRRPVRAQLAGPGINSARRSLRRRAQIYSKVINN